MTPDKQNAGDWNHDGENVASATECTGLIPALPRDEAEDAHYASLYATHSAAKTRKSMFRTK